MARSVGRWRMSMETQFRFGDDGDAERPVIQACAQGVGPVLDEGGDSIRSALVANGTLVAKSPDLYLSMNLRQKLLLALKDAG